MVKLKLHKYLNSSPKSVDTNGTIFLENNEFQLTALICIALKADNNSFKSKELNSTIDLLRQLNGRKLIYSEISNQMYTLSSDKSSSDGKEFANFITNVEKLKDVVLNDSSYQDLHDVVIKLYDHTQLANHQINVFRFNKEEFENMIKNSDEVGKKIESVNSQVLSLVALFTAMAFLVFGGLSAFESIFSNIQDVSTIKLSILSCIWGLGILNTIAVFMFFISKVIGKSFKQNEANDATLFQRYPYLILGNYILITLFCALSWIYLFVLKFDLTKKIKTIFSLKYWNLQRASIMILLIIIIVLLKVLFNFFFDNPKQKNKNKKSGKE